jgi:hypothetical protein
VQPRIFGIGGDRVAKRIGGCMRFARVQRRPGGTFEERRAWIDLCAQMDVRRREDRRRHQRRQKPIAFGQGV